MDNNDYQSVEAVTGLSLQKLASLELDVPVQIPNLHKHLVVATNNPEKYPGSIVNLPQIPDVDFVIFCNIQ